MAKHIVEENIIQTKFEVDQKSLYNQKTTIKSNVMELSKVLQEFITSNQAAFKSLNTSLDSLAAHFMKATQTMEKSMQMLSNTQKKVIQQQRAVQREGRKTTSNRTWIDELARMEAIHFRLTAAAATATYALNRLFSSNKDLYYLSQRIGMPVKDIEQYAFVMSQIGGNSEQAKQSLGKFSRTLQEMAIGKNTEALEVFGRLGMSQFDANGNVKSVTAAMQELRQRLSTVGDTATKVNFLRKLGFDENEFIYFLHSTEKIEVQFNRLVNAMAGADAPRFFEDAAKNGAMVTATMNRLTTTFDIFTKVLVNRLAPMINKALLRIQGDFIANSRNVAKSIEVLTKGLLLVIDVFTRFGYVAANTVAFISDFVSSLDRSGQKVAEFFTMLTVAMRLFTLQMMKSPFGKFIIGLSMALLLIEDYMYWKKSLEDDTYKSWYDWSAIEEVMEKFKAFKDKLPDPFKDWLSSLDGIIDKFGIIESMILGLLLTKIPDAFGLLMTNPKTAGVMLLLTGAGYLINKGIKEGWFKFGSDENEAPENVEPGAFAGGPTNAGLRERVAKEGSPYLRYDKIGKDARESLKFYNRKLYDEYWRTDREFNLLEGGNGNVVVTTPDEMKTLNSVNPIYSSVNNMDYLKAMNPNISVNNTRNGDINITFNGVNGAEEALDEIKNTVINDGFLETTNTLSNQLNAVNYGNTPSR